MRRTRKTSGIPMDLTLFDVGSIVVDKHKMYELDGSFSFRTRKITLRDVNGTRTVEITCFNEEPEMDIKVEVEYGYSCIEETE